MNQYFGAVVLCMVGISFSAAAMEKYNPSGFVHKTWNKKIKKTITSNRNLGKKGIKSEKDARSFIPVFKTIQEPKKKERGILPVILKKMKMHVLCEKQCYVIILDHIMIKRIWQFTILFYVSKDVQYCFKAQVNHRITFII